MRFAAPVPAGSRVRSREKLVSVEAKGAGRLLITTENTVEVEGQDKPALVANTLVMAVSGQGTCASSWGQSGPDDPGPPLHA